MGSIGSLGNFGAFTLWIGFFQLPDMIASSWIHSMRVPSVRKRAWTPPGLCRSLNSSNIDGLSQAPVVQLVLLPGFHKTSRSTAVSSDRTHLSQQTNPATSDRQEKNLSEWANNP